MDKRGKKIRLDALLVERGIASTVEKARALIMTGAICIDGVRVDKAGTQVMPDGDIQVRGEDNPYVSRGGLKLKGALDWFSLGDQDMSLWMSGRPREVLRIAFAGGGAESIRRRCRLWPAGVETAVGPARGRH